MKNRIFYGSRRLLLVFGVLFLSLALTVVSTQVFQHESYLAMAQSALVRNIPVDGNRGRILDRNGEVLAQNKPSYTIDLYAYDQDGDTVNRSIYGALSILGRYSDVTYLCELPIAYDGDAMIYRCDEIDQYLTEQELPSSASPEEALSLLYTRYGVGALPPRQAYGCLSLILGSQEGGDAYRNLSDHSLHQLMDLCQKAGIQVQVNGTSASLSLGSSIQADVLLSFIDGCENTLGAPPYQNAIPMSGPESPQWHTASIKRLKSFLSLPADASAQQVADTLMATYRAEAYNGTPYLLDLLAIRYAASGNYYKRYNPLPIAKTLDYNICAVLEENALSLPGIAVSQSSIREYPEGNLLSQVLGYTGRITAALEEEMMAKGYRPTDTVGRDGLERILEDVLHAIPGENAIMVDSLGRNTQTLSSTPPQDGKDVVLTIDLNLQKAAQESLSQTMAQLRETGYPKAQVGAAVAVDVNSGEILCMVSEPGYDPNVFSSAISEEVWAQLSPQYLDEDGESDPDPTLARPMVNVATASIFPPGSTYKPFVAAALLENGIITPSTTILDRGRYTGFSTTQAPGCWLYNQNGGTHGYETVSDALAHSCNYYFYDAAVRLGSNALGEYVKKFGFGTSTGVECLYDAAGIVGGEAYTSAYLANIMKQKLMSLGVEESDAREIGREMVDTPTLSNAKRLLHPLGLEARTVETLYEYVNNHRYRESQVLSLAIGQGENSFSVLQMANATAALSKKGLRYAPTLIKSIDGQEQQKRILSQPFLSDSTYAAISQGMQRVVQSGGTAAGAFAGLPIGVAAKTGTAEADGKDNYGWFIAYAPAEDPQIAVAVMIAQSGGGNTCIPVVRTIFEQYFGLGETPANHRE